MATTTMILSELKEAVDKAIEKGGGDLLVRVEIEEAETGANAVSCEVWRSKYFYISGNQK